MDLASTIWYSSTIKSFRRIGQKLNFLAVVRSSLVPPKKAVSVRMDNAEAPAFIYPILVLSTWAVPLIRPWEGDLLLNSAIIPVFSGSVTYFRIETTRLL